MSTNQPCVMPYSYSTSWWIRKFIFLYYALKLYHTMSNFPSSPISPLCMSATNIRHVPLFQTWVLYQTWTLLSDMNPLYRHDHKFRHMVVIYTSVLCDWLLCALLSLVVLFWLVVARDWLCVFCTLYKECRLLYFFIHKITANRWLFSLSYIHHPPHLSICIPDYWVGKYTPNLFSIKKSLPPFGKGRERSIQNVIPF